jgi:hypothetical protein
MTRKEFPGGWYADALPSGEYVVLFADQFLETHLGQIAFLDAQRQPLFPRCTNVGGFSFAGQSWHTDQTMEWHGGWVTINKPACGVSPVIYDNDGLLHISDCSIGSQGWRYVTPDNVLVTGDETYGPGPDSPGLYEWTDLNGLVIGQGAEGGVIVWDGTQHRILEAGPAASRFIRVQRDGDNVSIAWWGETGAPTTVVWATMDELRQLPVLQPVEPPVPPGEPMKIPATVWSTIQLFVGTFGIPQGDGSDHWTEAELRPWMHRLWEQLRFSHGPTWGGKSTSPTSPPSKDAIAYQPDPSQLHVWDILTGASSGSPTLSSDPSYYNVPDQHFIEVDAVDHLEPVEPIQRRPIAVPLRGISAFDLGCRLAEGDTGFLNQVIAPHRLVPRVVNASVYRTPRTPAEGLAQMEVTLFRLQALGLQGQFVLLNDTREFGLSKDQAREIVRESNSLAQQHPSAVYGLQLGNENSHGVEQPWMTDRAFLRELDALIDPQFPVSWGAGHGGEPALIGGSYTTHHSDRGQTPEVNADYMAQVQAQTLTYVIDDEPLGIAEAGNTAGRQRTDDPTYAQKLVEAAQARALGGVTLHMDAGLTCRLSDMGPVQWEAVRLFVETWNPAVPGDPILDAPLSPAYPTGYDFWIANRLQIQAAARDWYIRAFNREPAEADISHGLWRGLNEGERWGTLRRAWEETWPGGAPR